MKYVLSTEDASWLRSLSDDKPTLCRIVWVNTVGDMTRAKRLRAWALRNRLFMLDYSGNAIVPVMRRVRYEHGIGFYTTRSGGYDNRGAKRFVVGLTDIMRYGYLFTNGMQ